jgi:cell division protein FtsW
MRSLRDWGQFHPTLLLAQLVLIGFGLLAISTARPDDLPKQLITVAIGLLFTLIGFAPRPTSWLKLGTAFWIFTALGLLVTLIYGSVTHQQFSRWLPLGPFKFQFSELAKIAIILYLASFFSKRGIGFSWLRPIVIVGITSALVLASPSVSAAVFMFVLALVVMFVAGIGWQKMFAILFLAFALAVPTGFLFVQLAPDRFQHATDRFDGFMAALRNDPKASEGYSWQVEKTVAQLENAGFIGVGPDVPIYPQGMFAQTTDFVIGAVGHSTGMIGISTVFVMFALILLLGFQISSQASELSNRNVTGERQANLRAGSVLAASGTIMIVSQAIVNLGVAIGRLPNTGMTLPFVSDGGSSMIACGLAFGWMHRAWKDAQPLERRRERRNLDGSRSRTQFSPSAGD